MSCTTNNLSSKLVISVCDGRKLGHICNYEIDLECGTVCAVYVPGESGFLGCGKSSDIRIPWCKIKKIGEDAILAEVPPRIANCQVAQKRRWFR